VAKVAGSGGKKGEEVSVAAAVVADFGGKRS